MEDVEDKVSIPWMKDDLFFSYKAGVVLDSSKHSSTSISTYGGDVSYSYGNAAVSPVRVYSKSTIHHEFWVKLDNGEEIAKKLLDKDTLLRSGQRIAIVNVESKRAGFSYWANIINMNTGDVSYITSQDDMILGFNLRKSTFWRPLFLSLLVTAGLAFGFCISSVGLIHFFEENREKLNENFVRSMIPDASNNPYFSKSGKFNTYDDFKKSSKCIFYLDCLDAIKSKKISFRILSEAEGVYMAIHYGSYIDKTHFYREYLYNLVYFGSDVDGFYYIPGWAVSASRWANNYFVGQNVEKIRLHPFARIAFGVLFFLLLVVFSWRAIILNKKCAKVVRESLWDFIKDIYQKEKVKLQHGMGREIDLVNRS